MSDHNFNQNVRVTSPGKVVLSQALNSNIGTRIVGTTTTHSSGQTSYQPIQVTSINQNNYSSNTEILRPQPSNTTKISGYTPLMMQGSLAPVSSQQDLNQGLTSTFQPKQSQYNRQARDILLQPGFEAQAQTQNIKQSQYHKYTDNFKNQNEDVKVGQADFNIQNYQNYNIGNMTGPINTTGNYQGISGVMSTYINPNSAQIHAANNFRNAQNAEYMGELEKQLGELRLEGNHTRRNLVAMERQLEQYEKENKYLQAENANLLQELQNMQFFCLFRI